jgi:hypothetical protein
LHWPSQWTERYNAQGLFTAAGAAFAQRYAKKKTLFAFLCEPLRYLCDSAVKKFLIIQTREEKIDD